MSDGKHKLTFEQIVFLVSAFVSVLGVLGAFDGAAKSNTSWITASIGLTLVGLTVAVGSVVLGLQKTDAKIVGALETAEEQRVQLKGEVVSAVEAKSLQEMALLGEVRREVDQVRVLVGGRNSIAEWDYDKLAEEVRGADEVILVSLSETITIRKPRGKWESAKAEIFTCGTKKVQYLFDRQDSARKQLIDRLCQAAVERGVTTFRHHPLEGDGENYVQIKMMPFHSEPIPQGNLILLGHQHGKQRTITKAIEIGPDAFDHPERWFTATDEVSLRKYRSRFDYLWDRGEDYRFERTGSSGPSVPPRTSGSGPAEDRGSKRTRNF